MSAYYKMCVPYDIYIYIYVERERERQRERERSRLKLIPMFLYPCQPRTTWAMQLAKPVGALTTQKPQTRNPFQRRNNRKTILGYYVGVCGPRPQKESKHVEQSSILDAAVLYNAEVLCGVSM